MMGGRKIPQQSLEEFVAEFLAAREQDPRIYEPREDSFLILDVLAEIDLKRQRVLDLGTGSGILAAYCAKNGAEVTASDIDLIAIQALNALTRSLGISIHAVQSDIFCGIKGEFDIILFNPPYLPSQQIEDRTTDGGDRGTDVIHRFLEALPKHLRSGGYGILVVSSLNETGSLFQNDPILIFETLRQHSLFFEKLYAVKVKAEQAS